MLNHYRLAQSVLAWLKGCLCPCKYIFLQELGAVIIRLSNLHGGPGKALGWLFFLIFLMTLFSSEFISDPNMS